MGMTCYNFMWTYNCIQLYVSGGLSPMITCLISGYFYPLITYIIRLQLVSFLFFPRVETYKVQRAKTRILSSCSLFF